MGIVVVRALDFMRRFLEELSLLFFGSKVHGARLCLKRIATKATFMLFHTVFRLQNHPWRSL